MTDRSQPIIKKETFSQPIDRVWAAITEKDQMIQWYFEDMPAFEAKVGFETSFEIKSEERTFEHLWKVVAVTPLSSITYAWRFTQYPGKGLVTFDLKSVGDKTQLTLTNIGLETFPDDIPEFTRASCEGGWEYFINNRLKEYLS